MRNLAVVARTLRGFKILSFLFAFSLSVSSGANADPLIQAVASTGMGAQSFPGPNTINLSYTGTTTTLSFTTTGGGFVQQNAGCPFGLAICANLGAGTIGLGTATATMTVTTTADITNTGLVGANVDVSQGIVFFQNTSGTFGLGDIEQVSLSSGFGVIGGSGPQLFNGPDLGHGYAFTCNPGISNCPFGTNGDSESDVVGFLDAGQTITYDLIATVTVSASEVPESSSLVLFIGMMIVFIAATKLSKAGILNSVALPQPLKHAGLVIPGPHYGLNAAIPARNVVAVEADQVGLTAAAVPC